MFYLFVSANVQEFSYPLIVYPYAIVVLIIAGRMFKALLSDHGSHPGCLTVVFTLVITVVLTAISCGIGLFLLLVVYGFSQILGWLVFLFGCSVLVQNIRSKQKEEEARERSHNAWQSRHKDDLCNHCDAHRTANGEIRHSPSCPNR